MQWPSLTLEDARGDYDAFIAAKVARRSSRIGFDVDPRERQ
jgi:hypothetical protein